MFRLIYFVRKSYTLDKLVNSYQGRIHKSLSVKDFFLWEGVVIITFQKRNFPKLGWKYGKKKCKEGKHFRRVLPEMC